MKIWPEGYLAQEAAYCKNELDEFHKVDSDEWRDKHRKSVLDKRGEFKKVWDERSQEE